MNPLVAQLATWQSILDDAKDSEDAALIRRARKNIRALEAQLKAVAK